MSEESSKQNNPGLQAIAALDDKVERRFEQIDTGFEKGFQRIDNQLGSIRKLIVHSNIALDRLQSVVYDLRADLKELSEEFKQNQKLLSLK